MGWLTNSTWHPLSDNVDRCKSEMSQVVEWMSALDWSTSVGPQKQKDGEKGQASEEELGKQKNANVEKFCGFYL